MSVLNIYEGRPHTPYLVFLRRSGDDAFDLLRELGLGGYKELHETKYTDDYLCIADDGRWSHLADCYGYTHWHSSSFRKRVQKLAKTTDLFSFSVGDTEMSFDLELHIDGKLVRRIVWEDPKYDGGRLKEEFGEPLRGEDLIPRGYDPLEALWGVAEAQGIASDYEKIHVRAFGKKDGLLKQWRKNKLA